MLQASKEANGARFKRIKNDRVLAVIGRVFFNAEQFHIKGV